MILILIFKGEPDKIAAISSIGCNLFQWITYLKNYQCKTFTTLCHCTGRHFI